MQSVHRFAGFLFHEKVLPDAVDVELAREYGWDRGRFLEAVRWSRYFAISNMLRAGFYAPAMTFALLEDARLSIGILSFVIGLQILVVALELYKRGLFNRYLKASGIEPEARSSNGSGSSPDLPREVGGLFSFETPAVYRAIGVEAFRRLMLAYTEWARFSAEDRRTGKRSCYMGATTAEMKRFADNTFVSERVHAIGGLIDLIVLAVLSVESVSIGAAYVCLLLVADLYCVLLQRYNRVRISHLFSIRRSRVGQRT